MMSCDFFVFIPSLMLGTNVLSFSKILVMLINFYLPPDYDIIYEKPLRCQRSKENFKINFLRKQIFYTPNIFFVLLPQLLGILEFNRKTKISELKSFSAYAYAFLWCV